MKNFAKKFIKLFFLISLITVLTTLSSYAKEICSPYQAEQPGKYGGQSTLNCQICTTQGTCDVTYNNFSPYPGVSVNGSNSLTLEIIQQIPAKMKITLNGGPLYYNFSSASSLYEVYLKQLYFIINSYGVIEDIGGGIMVNGYYIEAESYLWGYLF